MSERRGGEMRVTNEESDQALFEAAMQGDLDRAERALRAGASPNATDEKGRTLALEIAARMGKLEVVQALLVAGASVDKVAAQNFTALMAAAIGGHPECLRELLEAGADPNRVTEAGLSVGHLALRGGNVECVRLLMEAGARTQASVSIEGKELISWRRFLETDDDIEEGVKGMMRAELERVELEEQARRSSREAEGGDRAARL